MKSVEERLARVVAGQLGIKETEVHSASNFVEDLGADSLDLIELVMACEEEFDIEVSDEVAEQIETFQQAADLIKSRV